MEAPFVAIGVFLFVVILTGLALFLWLRWTQVRLMRRLARELGLGVDPDAPALGPLVPITALNGTYKERSMRVYFEKRKTATGSRIFGCLHCSADNPKPLTLNITSSGPWGEALRQMGMPEVSLSDKAFSDDFIVKSRDPAFTRRAVDDQTRQLCREVWEQRAARGYLKLQPDGVLYQEAEVFRSSRGVRRFKAIADLCARLAERVETEQT